MPSHVERDAGTFGCPVPATSEAALQIHGDTSHAAGDSGFITVFLGGIWWRSEAVIRWHLVAFGGTYIVDRGMCIHGNSVGMAFPPRSLCYPRVHCLGTASRNHPR